MPRVVCFFGALAVVMGAFGAHMFSSQLQETGYVQTYETAVRYHFYHAFVMLLLTLVDHSPSLWKRRSRLAFMSGTILFSGSLYVLSLSGLRALGVVTPIGGALLIAGWLMLIPYIQSLKNQKTTHKA